MLNETNVELTGPGQDKLPTEKYARSRTGAPVEATAAATCSRAANAAAYDDA